MRLPGQKQLLPVVRNEVEVLGRQRWAETSEDAEGAERSLHRTVRGGPWAVSDQRRHPVPSHSESPVVAVGPAGWPCPTATA